ncbi:hypothetical protein MACJ_000401 [Theileria orientalis]|uniref:Transmembrane protein n=1 Tax=Theileria orientalis TaxID=68886 RepID=A0A976M402_THEOR|nr:hypothetical protein MACJ_000401 [Theileria orientalis]
MDSSETEEKIISKTTVIGNLSQSISEELGKSASESTVNEDNKEVKEETAVEKWDREQTVIVKSEVVKTKSVELKMGAELENQITQMQEGYDEELNSAKTTYVLNDQTPIGAKNIFVRKVLFIFIIETFTALFGSFLMFVMPSRLFLGENWYLGLVAIAIIWIFGIIVGTKKELIRDRFVRWVSVPIGILLVTVSLACLMSALTAIEVMISHVIFNLVFVVFIFFTFQKKVAVTGVYGDVLISCLLILGYGIIGAFVRYRHGYYAISAIVGSAIALYVVIVIKLIVNGKTKEKYTNREYGAVILILYIDYVMRIMDGFEFIFK